MSVERKRASENEIETSRGWKNVYSTKGKMYVHLDRTLPKMVPAACTMMFGDIKCPMNAPAHIVRRTFTSAEDAVAAHASGSWDIIYALDTLARANLPTSFVQRS